MFGRVCLEDGGCGGDGVGGGGNATLLEKRAQTVLDSLVRTILSQNTTDTLSKKAFDSLKAQFPTWKQVCGRVDNVGVCVRGLTTRPTVLGPTAGD